jgi:replicative superfamily II helicase
MVDFTKKLAKHAPEKLVDPQQIYDKLDRASDKGPLRPVQINILDQWFKDHRDKKDVILKMHTGQGKTLTGLLILQSKLNEYGEPVIYLCPNKHLVEQTLAQAEQFGVRCVEVDDELPDEFINGQAILVTNVKKLFNGLTKFHLGPKSQRVSTILIDDAHTCIESIKDAFSIKLGYRHPAYGELVALFENELGEQGRGSFAEIKLNKRGTWLAVPYWAWHDKKNEVTDILSNYNNSKVQANKGPIMFAWPLLRDVLAQCLCVITGTGLEIFPYKPGLYLFGTYAQARHRVFMSATVTNDAFLIKGLDISEDAVRNPLVDQNEKWSGEKMVLIPSLMSESLTDASVVEMFGKPIPKRNVGFVALTPSFRDNERWVNAGAEEANVDNIYSKIEQLKRGDREQGDREKTIVIANRYDGIDLPDASCRILIIDSVPSAHGLIERYIEERREGSAIFEMSVARAIEQGLGRAVRGDKDYCVILLLGPGLIKRVKSRDTQKFFSPQTRKQIEIGLAVTEMVSDEAESSTPRAALLDVINKCLRRDAGWKEYYEQEMTTLPPVTDTSAALKIFSAEARAEKKYQDQDYDTAAGIMQEVVDRLAETDQEKGWYLQEMARYIYPRSKARSNELQVVAHRLNRFLFKPREGMAFTKVETVGQRRAEKIIQRIRTYDSFEVLSIAVDEVLSRLVFGIDADIFEKSFDELGRLLGFESQRPDKEMKEGPDNLWGMRENQYLLAECKNERLETRPNIYRAETGQMNNSIAWFRNNYHGANVKHIMIHPANRLDRGADFNEPVEIMRNRELSALKQNVRSFFNEFKGLDFNDLSEARMQTFLNTHRLSVDDLLNQYSVSPVQ